MLHAAVSSSPARAARAGYSSGCMNVQSVHVLSVGSRTATRTGTRTSRTLSQPAQQAKSFSSTSSASNRRFEGRNREFTASTPRRQPSGSKYGAASFESRGSGGNHSSSFFARPHPRSGSNFSRHSDAPRGRGHHAENPRNNHKASMSPSEVFLDIRQNTMQSLEAISRKIAAEAKMQKDLLKQQAMSEAIPRPKYTIKEARVLPGEASKLFMGLKQNRDVLPGDLVEIRRGGQSTIGIFCQAFDQAEERLQSTSVVQGDKLMYHRTADVVFRIPGFAFTEKASKVTGAWDVDKNPTEPPKGMARLAVDFADQATLLMGTFLSRFHEIYNEFWNKRGQKSLSSVEAAQFVFNKEGQRASELTLQEVYAAHMFLTDDDSLMRFSPATSVRWTGEYDIRPPEEVESIETVVNWIRNEDGRIREFVDKAQLLLEASKNGTRERDWRHIHFSDSDRKVIGFLRHTAIGGYERLFNSTHLSYLPRLLRPFNLYDDMSPQSAFLFLTEIGVWPKWHNMEQLRAGVDILPFEKQEEEAMARFMSMHSEKLTPRKTDEPQQTKGAATKGVEYKPIVLEGPTDLYKSDPCDSIRHDFGMLPVYTIDDASATELDDGISMEPVPVSTLTPRPSTWIHVHVADPTSLLPPTHEISKLAESQVQSIYLPETFHPMLPRAITEPLFSLKSGCERPVMTFSARLDDETGEVLEHKVRPGIVRNVVTANYDDADDYLSWEYVYCGKEEAKKLMGRSMVMPDVQPFQKNYAREARGTIRKDDIKLQQDLQRLQQLSLAHMRSRIGPDRGGGMNFFFPKMVLDVSPSPLARYPLADWQAPIDFNHWKAPTIRASIDPSLVSPARTMVSEMMILGGRIATAYLSQNGLPMLFRTQPPPMAKYRATIERIQREKVDLKSGMMSLADMLAIRPYITGSEITLDARPHWMMGLKGGYTKVTSPLRRFGDMVAHWQIKGHLLGHKKPVFGHEALLPMANKIRERERILGMADSWTNKMWMYELMRRREEEGKPNVYEGVVMNPTEDGYMVMSSHYAFECLVKADPAKDGFDPSTASIGSKVVFEVVSINPQRPYIMGAHKMVVDAQEPVRLAVSA
ncbi:hypothetical protein BGZ73_007308 [Actinomortierella ambigua]|nr:hypothetical protein BGZ73_007308 [Actinomortierella ambigua]